MTVVGSQYGVLCIGTQSRCIMVGPQYSRVRSYLLYVLNSCNDTVGVLCSVQMLEILNTSFDE